MLDAADEIFAALEDQRLLLMAYADGVNAGPRPIQDTGTPSYSILNGRPRDSICVLHHVGRVVIERRMELVRGVYQPGPKAPAISWPKVDPSGRIPSRLLPEPLRLPTFLQRMSSICVKILNDPKPGFGPTCDGHVGFQQLNREQRDATGYAIMANDPHLPLSADTGTEPICIGRG